MHVYAVQSSDCANLTEVRDVVGFVVLFEHVISFVDNA